MGQSIITHLHPYASRLPNITFHIEVLASVMNSISNTDITRARLHLHRPHSFNLLVSSGGCYLFSCIRKSHSMVDNWEITSKRNQSRFYLFASRDRDSP